MFTDCFKCKFRKNVEDTVFSQCSFFTSLPKKEQEVSNYPKTNNPTAEKEGWWDFPYKYDPKLMDTDCWVYSGKT